MPREISKKFSIKYNTVRHILDNYFENGRVNVKEKMTGYKKNKSGSKKITNASTESCSAKTVNGGSLVGAENKSKLKETKVCLVSIDLREKTNEK